MIKEYKWMNPKTVEKKLEDALWDDYTFTTRTDKGHTSEVHIGQSTPKLLSRIVHEDKHYSSCFTDQQTADEMIQNALIYKVSDIVKWIQKDRCNCRTPKEYNELAIRLNMGEGEPIGRGFNDQLEELESPVVIVVLQRDFDLDTQFGFYVKSAYVDITGPEAELTGRAYTKQQVIDMDGITFASDVEEAAFTFRNMYPDLQVCYVRACSQDPDYLRIIKETEHGVITAYVTSDSLKIKERVPDKPARRLNLQDLDHEFADKLSFIQSTIKMKEQCRNMQEQGQTNSPTTEEKHTDRRKALPFNKQLAIAEEQNNRQNAERAGLFQNTARSYTPSLH